MKTMIAAVCALVAACGSSGPPDKLSGAFLETFRLYCDKIFACDTEYIPDAHSGRSLQDYAGGTDADACYDRIKTTFLQANGQEYLDALDASVAAGRIVYRAADFQACASSYQGQSCDQLFEQHAQSYTEPPVCRTVKVGQVEPGGACTLDDDCAAGFCHDDMCPESLPAAR